MIKYEKLFSADLLVTTVDEYDSIESILENLRISYDNDSRDCLDKYGDAAIHVYFASAKECEAFEAELEKVYNK